MQGNHVSECTLQQNYTRPEKIKVETFSFVNIYEDTAYKDIVLLSMRIVVSPQTTSRKVKTVYEKREKSKEVIVSFYVNHSKKAKSHVSLHIFRGRKQSYLVTMKRILHTT